MVYDLEPRVFLWVGDRRTEVAVRPFFTEEMGRGGAAIRSRSIRIDMRVPYAALVKTRTHDPGYPIW
jgi:hypothetical protein